MELIVPLNVQGDRPLYEQIYQYIKDEIRIGNIKIGKAAPFIQGTCEEPEGQPEHDTARL